MVQMDVPHLSDETQVKRMGSGCLWQSSRESGRVVPLVSGSIRQSPEPMMGPLLYTTNAATEITPPGWRGKSELARQPNRKLRFTREVQRCLDHQGQVKGLCCEQGERTWSVPDHGGEQLDAVEDGDEAGGQDGELPQQSQTQSQLRISCTRTNNNNLLFILLRWFKQQQLQLEECDRPVKGAVCQKMALKWP